MGGGGGSPKPQPAPIPTSPSRWLYDRNGDATTLQDYAHYVRNGKGGFLLVQDNKPLAPGQYLSPERAAEKNPKVWIYDSNGKAVKQIFKGGQGPDDQYDTSKYNLGPDAVPYRHWYDIYGVSQQYAPESTPIGDGYYDSPNKAPKSPAYQAPVPYNEVDPAMNIQGAGNSSNTDIAAAKAQAKKRRQGPARQSTLLSDTTDTLGSSGDSKTLLGE